MTINGDVRQNQGRMLADLLTALSKATSQYCVAKNAGGDGVAERTKAVEVGAHIQKLFMACRHDAAWHAVSVVQRAVSVFDHTTVSHKAMRTISATIDAAYGPQVLGTMAATEGIELGDGTTELGATVYHFGAFPVTLVSVDGPTWTARVRSPNDEEPVIVPLGELRVRPEPDRVRQAQYQGETVTLLKVYIDRNLAVIETGTGVATVEFSDLVAIRAVDP